jgi:hypothetical protein
MARVLVMPTEYTRNQVNRCGSHRIRKATADAFPTRSRHVPGPLALDRRGAARGQGHGRGLSAAGPTTFVSPFTDRTECLGCQVELHRDQVVGHVPLTVGD